jgi:transcriptional regulator with GAF, ATPase, and Fis domain
MTGRDREQEVVEAFVTLTTELTRGRDVVDLLSHLARCCASLLDVASVGLLLSDGAGDLHVLAASTEATRQLEVFQLQRADGPCLDAYHAGEPVLEPDLATAHHRWPVFVPAALELGFRSAHVVPLRLGEQVLGAMGLFGARPGSPGARDLALARALADVASVALVHDRDVRDRGRVVEQLERALDSRIVIEQAKGVLAQHHGTDVEQAFTALRHWARDHGLRLSDVARDVVSRELSAQLVVEHGARRARVR